MDKPAVSCICLTYGRYWLLAEAIESYLIQDYEGKSELVIINDFKGMELEVHDTRCNPNQSIRVVNLDERLESLNDKFDYGVNQATHDLIMMWDDDDICLSHRIGSSVKAIGSRPYLSFSHHWTIDIGSEEATLIPRGIHGGDIFTKECYNKVDGSQGKGHNDQNFLAKIKAAGYYHSHFDNEPFYVYRWGGITGHTSAYGPDLEDCMQKFHDAVISDQRFKTGRILVVPYWERDYKLLCRMDND